MNTRPFSPGRRPRYRRWIHPLAAQPALAVRFDGLLLELGTQIEQGRTAKGMTVEQLADRAGLSVQGTINIRKLQSDPKLSTIVRLASALDLEVRVVLRPRRVEDQP